MNSVLVIPFYQNEEYILNFERYFGAYPEERSIFAGIYVINDCPGSIKSDFLKGVCLRSGFTYIANKENLGFLKTANLGYLIAKELKANLVLLNSDTLPYQGAFGQLVGCFERDAMLGCVSPRSNNATISNYYSNIFVIESLSDFDEITAQFDKSIPITPRLSYVPVTNGFCFAIRASVVQSFDGFSKNYDPGYEEENEYCLRVASHGYRIGVANHSFIAHLEGRSFSLKDGRSLLKRENYKKLLKTFPYYERLLRQHEMENETKAYKKLVLALARGEKRVLIDARNLGPYHNGTNKLIVEFIAGLVAEGYGIDLLANKAAIEFHGLNRISDLTTLQELSSSECYLYGIKIGQPFNHTDLFTIPAMCVYPINIFFDTIALDCPQLRARDPEIYNLWSFLPSLYSHISFISEHSRRQFNLRFPGGLARRYANLLPRNFDSNKDFGIGSEVAEATGRYALVLGNKFEHKGVLVAISQLPIIEGLRYVVLGGGPQDSKRRDVEFRESGYLEDQEMDSLYKKSEFIVLPSFAEGFGYPLIEALSYKKLIYLRDIPCYREIIDGMGVEKQLIFLENFSKIRWPVKNYEINEANNSPEDYESYARNIMSQAGKNLSLSVFYELCQRIQTIDIVHVSVSPRKALFIVLTAIHSKLYKYKIFRPILVAGKFSLDKLKLSKSYLLS